LAKKLVDEPSSAAVRLYAYIYFDTTHLTGVPYDLTGIHQDGLLSLPEFKKWNLYANKLARHIRTLIEQGRTDGSLLPLDPVLVQQMISGINLNTIRRMGHKQRKMKNLPEFVADFILRGLLVDVSILPKIKTEAITLLTRITSVS
jgi:hypothetical protein